MVTTTQHYDVRREGSADFTKVPVMAPAKCPTPTWMPLSPLITAT